MNRICIKQSKNNIEKACMLLDRYTSAKWYVDQSKRLLQREYLTDCDTENDVICQVDAAGLYDNELQKEFTATLKYNKDIIRFINFALQSLKDAPDGEKLYTIIDVLYLQKETKGLAAAEQWPVVTNRLCENHYQEMSARVLYRLKKQALEIIAFILFDTSVELKNCVEAILKVS